MADARGSAHDGTMLFAIVLLLTIGCIVFILARAGHRGPAPGWPAGVHPGPRLGPAAGARRAAARPARRGLTGSSRPSWASRSWPSSSPPAGDQGGAVRRAGPGRLRGHLARTYRDGKPAGSSTCSSRRGPEPGRFWPVLAEAAAVRGRPWLFLRVGAPGAGLVRAWPPGGVAAVAAGLCRPGRCSCSRSLVLSLQVLGLPRLVRPRWWTGLDVDRVRPGRGHGRAGADLPVAGRGRHRWPRRACRSSALYGIILIAGSGPSPFAAGSPAWSKLSPFGSRAGAMQGRSCWAGAVPDAAGDPGAHRGRRPDLEVAAGPAADPAGADPDPDPPRRGGHRGRRTAPHRARSARRRAGPAGRPGHVPARRRADVRQQPRGGAGPGHRGQGNLVPGPDRPARPGPRHLPAGPGRPRAGRRGPGPGPGHPAAHRARHRPARPRARKSRDAGRRGRLLRGRRGAGQRGPALRRPHGPDPPRPRGRHAAGPGHRRRRGRRRSAAGDRPGRGGAQARDV